MAQLSYSFCMSMLHSLWQAGILVLVYWLMEKSLQQKFTPLQKKNLLFISLGVQSILSCVTFCIYYFNIENSFADSIITKTVTDLLSADIIYAVAPWLFGAYLSIITYKMIQTVYDWYNFKKKFNAGIQKPTIDLKLFTALKADHFGIKRKVQLWFSSTINTPLTFGFFKPVIILPVALVNQLSIKQAETLILHELTHIKANDYLLNWFLLVAENIFFFNPFILSFCKKIRLEREKYCDINVMAFEYPALTYAETLLQSQHVKQYFAQYQLAAVGKHQELLQRIKFFTNSGNHITQNKNRFTFPFLTSLVALIFVTTLFFQYVISKKAVPVVTASVQQPFTVNTEEIATPTFVNNVVESLTDEKLKEIVAAVEKQRPAIEKQVEKLQPLIKQIESQAATFAENMSDDIATQVIPVAIKENDATRQIVVKEEQSGSKNASLKVYTLKFADGKWVIQPEWKLVAKEITLADTLRNLIDTSQPYKETAY